MYVLKIFEDPKSHYKAANRRKTNNTMAKRKRTKGQTTTYKTLHRKQKIEQRNVTFATNINEICFNMI